MNLCRLCGSEQYLEAFCDLKDPELAIEFKLEKVFKIKLEQDVKFLSPTICANCFNCLENALDFYDTIIETQCNLLVGKEEFESFEDTVLTQDLQSGDVKLEMLIDDESPATIIESIVEEPTVPTVPVLTRQSEVKTKKPRITKAKQKRLKEIKTTNEISPHIFKMEDIFSNEFKGTYANQPDSLEGEKHQTCSDGSLTQAVAKTFNDETWIYYEWRCTFCSNSQEKLIFTTRTELEDHHKFAHRDERLIYSCMDCTLSFKSFFRFQNHIIDHRPILKFTCEVCNKIYRNLMDLHNHRMQCNSKLRYTCLYCGKIYESGFFMKQHVGHHQSFDPEELFYCDLCNHSAHTKFLIKQHLTTVHIGKNKELTCGICGKICKRSSDMRSHQLVHTNVRPYDCDLCDLKFKCSKQLKCHKRTHYTMNLVEECGVCQKKFMTKAKLARHFKIHTDEFSFTCEFCGRKFKHASGFKTHRRIHTGERPYLCKYENCGQRFIDWPNMNKHCKAKHAIDNSSRKQKVYFDA